MSNQAVHTAICACDKGSMPSVLLSFNAPSIRVKGKTVATISDLNFAVPFGLCAVTGTICTYVPASLWEALVPAVRFQDLQPLIQGAKLRCVLGGQIEVLAVGQDGLDLGKFLAEIQGLLAALGLGQTPGEQALAQLETLLGTLANPDGDTWDDRITDILKESGINWKDQYCAASVYWALKLSGWPGARAFADAYREAYVPDWVQAARDQAHGLRTTQQPRKGDLIAYDWDGDGEYDHIGIVDDPGDGKKITTVEGNTTTDHGGDDTRGVHRRHRDISDTDVVYIRVP